MGQCTKPVGPHLRAARREWDSIDKSTSSERPARSICRARFCGLNIASRRDALIIGRRFSFSAGYWRFPIGPVPEGRGEPSGLKMIPITSFAEKSDQAARFFVLNRSLRRFTPALRDGDPILCFAY